MLFIQRNNSNYFYHFDAVVEDNASNKKHEAIFKVLKENIMSTTWENMSTMEVKLDTGSTPATPALRRQGRVKCSLSYTQ